MQTKGINQQTICKISLNTICVQSLGQDIRHWSDCGYTVTNRLTLVYIFHSLIVFLQLFVCFSTIHLEYSVHKAYRWNMMTACQNEKIPFEQGLC